MVSKVFIFALFIGMATAATWRGRLPEKPEEFAHKEGCYIEEINDVIPFGTELKPIGHCYRIYCGRQIVDYASCGTVGTDDQKCYVTPMDLSKPYPECCPDIECDLDNNII